ncbi:MULTISPECIES: monovalent cation/H+ antiporter complex subunit F [Actinoalloteichus]|uniref:Multicomponent Na+:H+ antiporter subunit F n=1 Tax=Actinoalloteichus caeruleus DSM 43889 TaxID=1120930 RepID=A0ABT1JQL8_ACTCY|nr:MULTISPECIES: monovalent cation/H+ antiporter complex subunit F [Actinoalloteichus]MCP2333986.1 multicomponent Na+:H+ antiporter subunit F [Actinoalloteichus caeruleus DSM 43889]
MILIDLAIVLVALSLLAAVVRLVRGPSDADRGLAGDLVFFGFVALVALVGLRADSEVVFDVVLVATLVGFLASLSIARLVTGGKR